MKDLRENLEPEDLEELGLKLGEKKRLKKFLDKLHNQDISELSPGRSSILYSSNLNLIMVFFVHRIRNRSKLELLKRCVLGSSSKMVPTGDTT